MVNFSAKKKAFLWVPISQLFWPSCSWTDLSSHLSISRYKRYVDDIYLQTTCEDMADQFHSTMKNLPQTEVWNRETRNYTNWPLTITTWFQSNHLLWILQKTAKKPIFVHHQSAIPKKSKINFIRNERKRIEDKCSGNGQEASKYFWWRPPSQWVSWKHYRPN